MNNTALIDGDILVYKIGYASQKVLYKFINNATKKIIQFKPSLTELKVKKYLKEQDLTMEHGKLIKTIEVYPKPLACYYMRQLIQSICNELDTDAYKIILSSIGKQTFRYDLATFLPYKGNRTQPKPKHYDLLRDYLVTRQGALVTTVLEADDALARLQCKDTVICSIDKDLLMIPGKHYNFVTKKKQIITKWGHLDFSKLKGRYKLTGGGLLWFYAQLILGDSVDNIQGLKGKGPKFVYDHFKKYERYNLEYALAANVLQLYIKEYGKNKGSKWFYENVDLLWILQDTKRKSIELKKLLEK